MKTRLVQRIADNAKRGRRSLAMFLTAGYPGPGVTPDLVLALEEGGADVVEIGVPFSDPLADGPVIQHASTVALGHGITLPAILTMVASLRLRTQLPLVLMGYLNPIMRYGKDRFFADAAAAGVDGVILPELPLEEWARFAPLVDAANLAGVLLATPTTPPGRIRQIDASSTGFVYCVSTTGVTGGTTAIAALDSVRAVRAHCRQNPTLVGFGIAEPGQARAFAREADGVIIGSALLRHLATDPRPAGLAAWTRGFRQAIDDI